jgi:hypothetical protein
MAGTHGDEESIEGIIVNTEWRESFLQYVIFEGKGRMDNIGYAEESGTGTTYGKLNKNYNRKRFHAEPDPDYPFGGTGHVPLILVPYTEEEIAAREEEEAARNARVRKAVAEEEKRMEENAKKLAAFRRKQQQEKNNANFNKNPLEYVYGKGGRRRSRKRKTRRRTRRTRK